MKKKLINHAIITSPILALYGIAPIFIFKILHVNEALFLLFVLTLSVFVQWLFNIYIYSKFNFNNKLKIYFYSFGFSLLLQIPRVFVDPNLPFTNKIEQFFIYPIIISFAITIIINIICKSVIISEKNALASIEIDQLKIQNLEAQKQTLMQQLQPHFLFNSLSVLKSLIAENASLAQDYSVKLSDFLRYSVESHKTELVTLQQELDFVNNYIELQKIRFENAFEFSVKIPNEILDKKVPVFAVQTLVENAFKHNYFTDKKPLQISIDFENEQIKVTNNKVSIRLVEKSGTGLENLNKRYELIAGKSIEISENENSFCVKINLI